MKRLRIFTVTMFFVTMGWPNIEAAGEAGHYVSTEQAMVDHRHLLSGNSDPCVITVQNAHTAGLIETLTGHADGAWNAVFSHEGNMLATCGQDGQVRIHDFSDPDTVIRFVGHTEWVLGLAFSPDDRLLASTGTDGFGGTLPGVIKIWDVATAGQVLELPGHANGSWSLDFQEGTSILASCGKDGLVKLWDSSNGDLINALTGHSGWVLSVDFHPNQDLVASSGVDRSVRIWNSQTGEQVHLLTGHTSNVGSVKFSPDGSYLVSGADDGTVRLWDVAGGAAIWSMPAGQGWINGVNFCPDGELIMTCGHDGSVVLRRTIDGMELNRLTEHTAPVLRGSFNSSGTMFATASWDSTVRVWGICLTGIEDEEPTTQLPRAYSLSQNYPNPFNPITTISFDVPREAGKKPRVTLSVRNLRGCRVRTLIDGALDPGCHTVVWDGRNDRGIRVPSGVYLYTLKSETEEYTRKMVLSK